MASANDCVMSSADSSWVRRSASDPNARDVDDDEDDKPDCPSAAEENEQDDASRHRQQRVNVAPPSGPQNVDVSWQRKQEATKVTIQLCTPS